MKSVYHQGGRRGSLPKLCRKSWPGPETGKELYMRTNVIIDIEIKVALQDHDETPDEDAVQDVQGDHHRERRT